MTYALISIYTAVIALGPHDPNWMMLVVMSALGTWVMCAVVEGEVRK